MTNKPGICAGLIANMVRFSATEELEKSPHVQSVRIPTLRCLPRSFA